MLVLGALYLIIGVGGDTLIKGAAPSDTTPTVVSTAVSADVAALEDTVRRRKKAVEMSDWYYRRLIVHRYTAYSTLPVFAAQWAAGKRLFDESRDAPTWAKTTHRVGATYLAGAFTVNTVTGLWNLWDSRSVEQGRLLRTIHALTMVGADAAFTYAGAKLSEEAENSVAKRREHRTIALSAMALTIVSGTAMKLFNH
jgi:hypothetical protein